MFYYLGNKVELIDDTLRKRRNKATSWAYGYNEEFDVIIISKDGTLGNIYHVNGINIGLPEMPERQEIINWDKTDDNQVWKREDMPKGMTPDNDHKPEFDAFIEKHIYRRKHGTWIYLGGKPVYLAPTYYFFIQWIREGNAYPTLRIIQNELMLFWEACKADERCYGIAYTKNRRFGWSALCFTELLESGTRSENKLLGIVSKRGGDAKKIFNRMVRSFKRIPYFFKPEVDGTSTPKSELIFAEPTRKRKKGEVIEEDAEGLDTSISWHNTDLNAMDGDEIFRSMLDECFGKGTKILMSDMTFKNIEDINVGDEVIVEGGKIMKVGKTITGKDEMYKISQPYSNDYIVNSKHRLYLEQRCKVKGIKDDGIKIMTPIEYLSLGKYRKRTTFGVRSNGLELPYKEVEIDPYILGLWLGDGIKDSSTILVNEEKDFEIGLYISKYVKENNFSLSITKTRSDKCKKYTINRPLEDLGKNGRWCKNKFRNLLKKYNLFKNKHIPNIYINNTREVRLKVLAGLLDTDGYLNKKNIYELTLSDKGIISDVSKIARSLGFKVIYKERRTNFETICHSIRISGNTNEIPCLVKRKQVSETYKTQYSQHINKISIEPIGVDDYFGITLIAESDEDRRLILEDFTISMNCGKFPKETPFSEYWSIVKTSHEIGSEIVGKAMVGSTVNALKKGGAEYKSVYYDSDPYKRDENGQTVSGLYKVFIPARFCMAGFFDRYGFSIVEDPKEPIINDKNRPVKIGAKTYLLNRLEALKSKPEKYNERLRQYPDTEEDAFRDEAGASQFDLMKIMGQISYNHEELNDVFDGEKLYYGNDIVIQGNLIWKDGIEDTEVVFVPSKEGAFFVRKDCFPPDTIRNKKERRFKRETGVTSWAPTAEGEGCFGADPFNRDFDIEGRASKGAIHLYLNVNSLGLPAETYGVEYIHRPRTVRMFFEDLIKACVFWSMPVLPELSNEALQQYFIDRGYRNFILNNPFKTEKELSANEKLYGGVPPQGDKVADKQFYTIQEYIDIYVGEAMDESKRKIGQMGDMYFTRTLLQWKDFTPTEKRTKYDAYISSSLARCGCHRRGIKENPEPPKPIPVRALFKTYNNNGNVSVSR